MSADRDMLDALSGSDLDWWTHTQGFCGGCGDGSCHAGPCGDVDPLFPDPFRSATKRVCDRCPSRLETGQIREVRP